MSWLLQGSKSILFRSEYNDTRSGFCSVYATNIYSYM